MAIGVSFPVFAYKDLKRDIPSDFRVLALDPGETTGWCYFLGASLMEKGEIGPCETVEGAALLIEELFDRIKPHCVVGEGYRVYAWKARSHTHSDLFTPRLIGAISLLCAQKQIKRFEQTAHQAKSFVSDDKLKEWNFYRKGESKQKHARDAVRHAVYYLLFGKLPKVTRQLKLATPTPAPEEKHD
jgi:hypothetical protein